MKKQTSFTQAQIISLIGEELKCAYLFNTFASIGFDHSYYRPDLTDIILAALGLPDTTNATLDFYYQTIQQHCYNLKPDPHAVAKQARLAYRQLVRYQRTRHD